MGTKDDRIKMMISSTVYGHEQLIQQVCSVLESFGYEVWCSHFKTIPVSPQLSNTENCIRAVESCDCFLGIILPRYGAIPDPILGLSITHQEVLKAIELKKPNWFIAHRDISIARQLLKQYMYLEDGKTPNPNFVFRRTEILDNVGVIHLYNDAIKNDVAPKDRVGHWVDEFFRSDDLLKVVDTQFRNIDRVREIIKGMNG